jgi:hypothetical protein
MKNDRFLNGMLIGIGVLILIALTLFFIRQQQADYRTGETPQDVVYNYTLAVMKRDYERAYSYLADSPEKPNLTLFQQDLARTATESSRVSLTIGEVIADGNIASITLSMNQSYGGPFNNVSRYNDSAQLRLENGSWKLVGMPYPLWSWNWFTEEAKPVQ